MNICFSKLSCVTSFVNMVLLCNVSPYVDIKESLKTIGIEGALAAPFTSCLVVGLQ